ncbi:hypothetical protein ABZP36_025864 [Zizania latifolia]
MDMEWEDGDVLGLEKQHKGANARCYINWRLVQWLLCVPCRPCGSAHAKHMHIPVSYHADNVGGREQWGLRRPPDGLSPSYARAHGIISQQGCLKLRTMAC